MERNVFKLAAIASAAVPGMNITGVSAITGKPEHGTALLVDDKGKQWCIRSSDEIKHSIYLDNEFRNLQVFSPSMRAGLFFLVPNIIGFLRHHNTRSYVYSHTPGTPFDISWINNDTARSQHDNPAIAESIGQCLAELHNISIQHLEADALPCYTSQQTRRRKLKELDQCAATGKIPAQLLTRWENVLENVSLWHFTTTVVHGSLSEEHIFVDGPEVKAITGWDQLHGGDPAEDFAWLMSLGTTFRQELLQSYRQHIKHPPDPHLTERAQFLAEFALAQWLVEALAINDAGTIKDAEEMLNALNADLEQAEYAKTPAAPKPGEES